MYFTKEDLEKIKKYVTNQGIKDSEFDIQSSLRDDDWFTIVGASGNKKIKASVLYNLFVDGGTGSEFLKNGIQCVDTLEELNTLELKVYGNLVYVKQEDEYYSYSNNDDWQSILKVYIGNEEPNDPTVLWIDEDTDILDEDDSVIKALTEQLTALQKEVNELSKLRTFGIIPGTASDSYREALIKTAEPEKPIVEGDEYVDEEEIPYEVKPESTEAELTVFHNCVKKDTSTNFGLNKANLVDGEMVFFTDKYKFAVYHNGLFYITSSGDNSSGGSGLTVEDLYALPLDYLIFSYNDNKYKAKVDSSGKWNVTPYSEEITLMGSPLETWGTYVNHLLCMNSIYCGGEGSSDCLCSHNYIELANGSTEDVNLKGLYLLYTDNTKEDSGDIGYIWKTLPLEGIIKAGSTFTIRGAQCNTPKACLINVDTYDIEWRIDGELIKFHQNPASFYLVAGNEFQVNLDNKTLNNPWLATEVRAGYIDACGFGEGSVGEGSATFLVNSNWNDTLFVRWYMLEPAKQGNKAHKARKTTVLWTYIDLRKQTTKNGNSLQYYYPDYMKQKFNPEASYNSKNFFSNKNLFKDSTPNMLNITFGIQATDNGEGATRCFNWVSVGYYDEYIEYRKKGESTWNKQYSYIDEDANNSDAINKFIHFYQRLRWCTSDGTWVTTHKTIIHNLEAGDWEYRVGRDEDTDYNSDINTFTVYSNDDVKSFTFIHTSDQQGFNWAEYSAWKKASYMIDKSEKDFMFTINTGDITQSGNRVSEWLAYYEGRQFLRNKEEMFCIGNNDLCGYISTDLTNGEDATSKYNHINILRYFTFELDVNNDYEVTWDNNTYPIYSLYSFNFGDYHFIGMNSEITKASSKMYKDWESDTYAGDQTFAEAANAQMETWLLKDLQNYSGKEVPTNCSKCIVFCHEMPFTMVTYSFMAGESARAGSKLNIYNENGTYRFSRLFKKYGIRLVMGGHKHTYTISKPIYDAPESYIDNNAIRPTANLMDNVTDTLSRKPVIQVLNNEDVHTSNFARYEVVSKLNAPTYVMSQATGYKLVSNKEQPSDSTYVIPWLLNYFKQPAGTGSGTTENVAQHMPMYIKYTLKEDAIDITATQVQNIYDVNLLNNTAKFDFNNQLDTLNVDRITLNNVSDADKKAYNITNKETYTITL